MNGFLGGGVVCEYWGHKVIGIISVVKAEQAIEILRRGETHGFSLECEEWSGGSERKFWEDWDGEEVLLAAVYFVGGDEEVGGGGGCA